jgi:hypothetical protein
MIIFSSFAFKFHYWMLQIDKRIAADPKDPVDEEEIADMKLIPGLWSFVALVRFLGKFILWPLTLMNAFVELLRLAGQHEMIEQELARLGFTEEAKLEEVEKRVAVRGKVMSQHAIADASDANSQNFLRILNLLLIPVALVLLIGSCQAAMSDFAQFVDVSIFICAITASAVVLVLATAGFHGSVTRSRRILGLYTTFVVGCLCVQIAVACLIFAVDGRIENTGPCYSPLVRSYSH